MNTVRNSVPIDARSHGCMTGGGRRDHGTVAQGTARLGPRRVRRHQAPVARFSSGLVNWYCQNTRRTAAGCGGSGARNSGCTTSGSPHSRSSNVVHVGGRAALEAETVEPQPEIDARLVGRHEVGRAGDVARLVPQVLRRSRRVVGGGVGGPGGQRLEFGLDALARDRREQVIGVDEVAASRSSSSSRLRTPGRGSAAERVAAVGDRHEREQPGARPRRVFRATGGAAAAGGRVGAGWRAGRGDEQPRQHAAHAGDARAGAFDVGVVEQEHAQHHRQVAEEAVVRRWRRCRSGTA